MSNNTEIIAIYPYNPEWKAFFSSEEKRIQLCLEGEYKSIMHIGSTSIEGTDAKPIVDISVAVPELKDNSFYEEKLWYIGYKHCNGHKFEKWILFDKSDSEQKYHLHLMPYDSMRLFKQVLFKIYMEENPEAADLYVRKKRAYLVLDDHIWYSINKKPFVDEVNAYAILDAIEHPIYWRRRIENIMRYVPHVELFTFEKEQREAKQDAFLIAYRLLKKNRPADQPMKIEDILKVTGLTQYEISYLF